MLSNKNNNHYIYFDISLFIFLFCNIIWVLFDPFEPSFQMLFHINLFNFIFYFGILKFPVSIQISSKSRSKLSSPILILTLLSSPAFIPVIKPSTYFPLLIHDPVL
jgi:hypothetical protein